jgi:hypothetical protein
MGKKLPIITTSTEIVGNFNMSQSYDMGQMALLPLRRKTMLRIFPPEKSDGFGRV